MGNRGKGAKGKSGKKGKKGSRKGGGGASKWGDEAAAQPLDPDHDDYPLKKKRRLTQEVQDRRRRVKIMELTRAKNREQTERLGQPNSSCLDTASSRPTPRKRRRPRSKRFLRRGGATAYYGSSDEDAGADPDASLSTSGYEALLSSLEGSNSNDVGVDEDHDLADAVAFRQMQREGRDDLASESEAEPELLEDESGSEASGHDSRDEEEIDEDHEGDDAQEHGKASEMDGRMEADVSGVEADNEAHRSKHDVELGEGVSVSNPPKAGSHEHDGDADNEHIEADEEARSRRGKDDFLRHFVNTAVFPEEKARELLSAIGRPSFKSARPRWSSRWAAEGLSARVSGNAEMPPALSSEANLTKELGLLPSLEDGWKASCEEDTSELQSLLLPCLTGYRDMLYCGWRDEDATHIRRCYAVHALNHALTSQRRVVRHNARLRKLAEEARLNSQLSRTEVIGGESLSKAHLHGGSDAAQRNGHPRARETLGARAPGAKVSRVASTMNETIDPEADAWQRDQGFTRPKVLILLPFRGLAFELVEIMVELLGPKTVLINGERFAAEYGPDEESDAETSAGDSPSAAKADTKAKRERAVLDRKPPDWKALLGEGRNVDDMFTLGVSLSPGGGKGKPGEGKGIGMRLYCDFYNSDIILASPVAMHRAAVPSDENDGGSGDNVDADFLSSIEVCILDRADVFLMQNWAYIPDIAEVLNARPLGERAARVDFSRVRPLFLHQQGRLFRQTLAFSAVQDLAGGRLLEREYARRAATADNDPDASRGAGRWAFETLANDDPNLNALVSKHLRNHDGVICVSRPSDEGSICEVVLQVKQVFQEIPCESPASQDDARFEYFVGSVLPQLLRAKQSHTAIFIPSYFDYVRIRNHLMKNKMSVVNVHEYSRASEVARSRARFFRGERDLLLYTGRAHFFNRYRVRGIHHLIFYSLPSYAQFYPEMVNLLEEAANESVVAVTCLSLFTRFERFSLQRIVGQERANHMLASAKNTFLFC